MNRMLWNKRFSSDVHCEDLVQFVGVKPTKVCGYPYDWVP